MKKQFFTGKLVYLLVLLTLPFFSFSQKWTEMMQDPNQKFSETVAEFENWWGNRDTDNTKGTGYKQFQRWKYYMESRLTQDGRQAGPLKTLQEFQSYYRSNNLNNRSAAVTAQWTEIGPVNLPLNGTGQPNGVGRVTAIAFHPSNPNKVYVGSPAGGFIESNDYGSTWTNKSTALTRLGVSSIVVHPTTPNTIYIGTGDRDGGDAPGRGVWRSTDGGQTWAQWNSGMGNKTVYEILMHPGNPDIMIASTNGKIYRTTDGGQNWTQQHAGGNNKDIAFHPTDPNIVYASGTAFYRSTDNGVTWVQVSSGLPSSTSRIAIAVTSANTNYVYLIYGNGGGFQGLYRSTDSGVSFTQRSNTPNILGYDTSGGTGSQAWYDLVAIGDAGDADHIIIGGINIWESFDGGQSWSIVSHWVGSGGNPAVHADQHVLEWNPHTGDLFAGHDGGLHFSTDNGASFTEISSGLGISQIYKIGQSAMVPDLTIAGFQDNGTALIDKGVWRTEIGGDGMECIVDYSDDNVMYGALYYGDIRRSTNRGVSFGTIAKNGSNGINESGGWVTPYKLNPVKPDTMYVGYKNVWRSFNCKSATTGTVTWERVSSFGTNNLTDLGISAADENVLYVSKGGTSKFLRSDNINAASPGWTDLTAGLPTSSTPKDIEVSATSSAILWIALGNDIYRSDDSGASWTNISGTLPNLSLNTIVSIPNHPQEGLYVGMDVGVYYKDNTIADWEYYGDFLPNTEVLELELYYDEDCPSQSKLMAATYGRGLWETPLYYTGNEAPVACFEASTVEGCVGSIISFYDYTAYGPTSWSWQISPGTYTYEGGTTSNSQNPVVKFNELGQYTITLTATNTNGSDQEVKTAYIDINSTALTVPFTEDFESMSLCGTGSDCGATVCSLNNGWINAENGTVDNIDWRVDNGGTPSSGTGPSIDDNPGTSLGKYIYTEASSCFNNTAVLLSPCIDLSGTASPTLSFAYHMNGNTMGSLHLDVLSNGIWQEDVIMAISGNQGNSWNTTQVGLASFSGEIVTLRFRGITGSSYTSDIALDDISIVDEGNCMVTNTTDSGPGSLRHCVDNAVNGQMITFDPSIHNTEIVLVSGAITIANTIDIMSLQSNNVGISAIGMERAFDIEAGMNVHINGLIIRSGTATSGRGIRNQGMLTLEDVDVYDNNALAGTGSLIENTGEITILGNCNILIDNGKE